MDDLLAGTILDGLPTRCLGHRIASYETADSTNSVARALADEGAPEGTLVIANEQTQGRGRLDRLWLAPRGTSLLFSLVFRPLLEPRDAQGLTMVCGLGVREAIRQVTGLRPGLKWPNDIMLHGRKTGGILAETSIRGSLLEYVVIGVGVNVNLDVSVFPGEWNATSISHELGRSTPRTPLLQRILTSIEERYDALRAGRNPYLDWASALETIGKWVELRTAEGTFRGRAEGVDEEGALLLRLQDGSQKRVVVGDIVAT